MSIQHQHRHHIQQQRHTNSKGHGQRRRTGEGRRNPLLTTIRLAFAAPLLALPLVTRAQSGYEDIGTLGLSSANVAAVSADGSVVVGDSAAAADGGRSHAFRWTAAGGMVDLGVMGMDQSTAKDVSADGSVVVGYANTFAFPSSYKAFRWTSGGGMVELGDLGGGAHSYAYGVSADGIVVVGTSQEDGGHYHAFRWVLGDFAGYDTTMGASGGSMYDLGTLGGNNSTAKSASSDGSVVVGYSDNAGGESHAFRWVLGDMGGTDTSPATNSGASGGSMYDLGTLGGTSSEATRVSADGAVVVGWSTMAGDAVGHAFRWTQAGGLVDLDTLGGSNSYAYGISADGTVVVGASELTGDTVQRAFRWTEATGMQTVEDWLRAAGVTVASDFTLEGIAANSDGSVVVGHMSTGHTFVARVSPVGSGLVTVTDLQDSLAGTARGGSMALSLTNTVLNGAHSQPLARRVAAGQKTFWLTGDWGRDDHGSRDGDLGLAEMGLGKNFGSVQINVSLGQTWAKQNLVLNGRAKADGTYLLAEALFPLADNLWATASGYGQRGKADLRRGYLNAGLPDASSGTPGLDSWGLRGRLEWDRAYRVATADFSPYVDLSYSESKLDAYTETGGGFPARFDARRDKATELRLGVNLVKPLTNGMSLLGQMEAAHRFEKSGSRTSGSVIGLFSFDLAGTDNKRDWLRLGAGVAGKLADGRASLSLNLTTQGKAPSAWLAAAWQRAF